MFDVKAEVNNVLFNSFKTACEKVYKTEPIKKKIAEIKIGSPIFTNALHFVTNKKNGFVTLSNGEKIDYLTATKITAYTVK